MALTPMMQQYFEIKNKYKDAILFYRLGDFYEMFFDDAKTASRLLDITLTGRACGEEQKAPMCGVPFHSADMYIGKLVAKGYKVVICEQIEDPQSAKGIVKRDIVRIVTPGTVTDNTQLDDTKNNFLSAICKGDNGTAIANVDVSTGQMTTSFYEGENTTDEILNCLGIYRPSEVMSNKVISENPRLSDYIVNRLGAYLSEGLTNRFDFKSALAKISTVLPEQVTELRDRGSETVCAVGALLGYIEETQMTDITNVTYVSITQSGTYMELDIATRRNLELSETMRSREKKGSLLGVLDRTKTSAGARMLQSWIEQPLLNASKIGRRQRAVAELTNAYILREEIASKLSQVLDLDRLMTRIVYKNSNARDLRSVCSTLSILPDVISLTEDFISEELAYINRHIDSLSDVCTLIDSAISEEPPITVREGGLIKRGYSSEVDELYNIVHDGKSYINKIAEEEREKTGIKNLKISYNRVFGYYIEITKSNLADVPDRYIRKQTLVNAERFITEELKEKEALILGASDKLTALEYSIFSEIRDRVASQMKRIQDTASLLARLDCYVSLADVAIRNGYVCPEIEYGNIIKIKDGRHPVVEQFSKDGFFVPNDTLLDTSHNRLALITGPNMAGKSTYMRQVALITLMAQMGSFVPASEARIGIVDKIFTRVGASDDLASGSSTFMLEMSEVAYILKNATQRSLIVYDEIGRGTSTYDGMSIAKAVAEYTVGKRIGAKTLFATHYHELTELEGQVEGVVNYNIAAKKKGDDITFLRKIIRGATDESYGIEVAKLAGVPSDVIRRAKNVLRELTEQGKVPKSSEEAPELNSNITFDDFKADEVRDRLLKTDVNLLTPIEALNLLCELKRHAE